MIDPGEGCSSVELELLAKQLVCSLRKKVQVGKDQENAQSEKDSHSENQGGKKPN